jgi:hypothetical protein
MLSGIDWHVRDRNSSLDSHTKLQHVWLLASHFTLPWSNDGPVHTALSMKALLHMSTTSNRLMHGPVETAGSREAQACVEIWLPRSVC